MLQAAWRWLGPFAVAVFRCRASGSLLSAHSLDVGAIDSDRVRSIKRLGQDKTLETAGIPFAIELENGKMAAIYSESNFLPHIGEDGYEEPSMPYLYPDDGLPQDGR